jgi:hypothetical protein
MRDGRKAMLAAALKRVNSEIESWGLPDKVALRGDPEASPAARPESQLSSLLQMHGFACGPLRRPSQLDHGLAGGGGKPIDAWSIT